MALAGEVFPRLVLMPQYPAQFAEHAPRAALVARFANPRSQIAVNKTEGLLASIRGCDIGRSSRK